MGYLSLRICRLSNCNLYFVWCVFVYSDRDKRGQTSRPVVRAQTQTSCNFEANLFDGHCFLACVNPWFDNVLI